MAMEQAYVDGPALTTAGIVVDLDGGCPIFFSHSKTLSPSHAEKEKAKEFYRMLFAMQLSHSLDEMEPIDLPSLDSDGHVRVPWVCLPLTGVNYTINDLRKKAYRKRQSGKSSFEVFSVDTAGVVQTKKKKTPGLIAIDASGTALATDVMPQTPQDKENENTRKKLFHKKKSGSFQSDSDCILSIDHLGIGRKKEKWSLDIEPTDPDAHQFHKEPEAESPYGSPKLMQPEPDAERSPEHRPMSFPMLPVSCY